MNAVAQYQQSPQELTRQQRVAGRLCERTPEENLKHMEVVAKGRGLSMITVTSTKPQPDGSWRTVFVEAKFAISATNETRRDVLAAFNEMLTPATSDMIFDWLSLLAIKTNKKSSSEKDKAAELRVYADELKGFPADVVRYALQAKHYRWWPPVGDILRICDEQVADRVAVISKLQSLIVRHEQDDYKTPAPIGEKVRTKADFESIDEIMRRHKFVPKVSWTEI